MGICIHPTSVFHSVNEHTSQQDGPENDDGCQQKMNDLSIKKKEREKLFKVLMSFAPFNCFNGPLQKFD